MVLAQEEKVLTARFAKPHFFSLNFGILVELGQSFVKPKWQPFLGTADYEVRVFVIHGGIRILTLGIEAQKNVILVRCSQEKAREVQLTLGKIGFRF